ncbi:RNA polymerase-interacting CarD/CdnL/TRCF family regulator [Pedobacter sp. UYP24]
MKQSLKIFTAALMAAMLFSFFSGCKSKQKLVKTGTTIDKSASSSSDSTHVIASNLKRTDNIDSAKLVLSSRASNQQQHTLELHFKLDSSKKIIPLDSTGNFDLRQLINRGLQNATSLIIKVTDQQSQSEVNSTTKERIHKQSNLSDSSKDSTGVKKTATQKDIKKTEKEVQKSKDSTVAKNTGGGTVLLFVILGSVAIVCFFLFKR